VTDGDGCSATCTVEKGFMCHGWPSTCTIVCGDGSALHAYPASNLHVSLQPSPETGFPSSHVSVGAVITPSPHTMVQVLGQP
jgi:hypothetical protein